MHPTIRRVSTPDEWRAAALLLDEYVDWLRDVTGLEPFTEQPGFEAELADLRRSYGAQRGGLFIAWSQDAPVGIVGLSGHADASVELKRLYVRPELRQGGIADRLVHYAIRKAAAQGFSEIWLESLRHVMEPAIRLYVRNGFEQQTTRPRSVALDDIIVMSRRSAPREQRPTPSATRPLPALAMARHSQNSPG